MVKQVSYTKFENEILPAFRQKLNTAESTEDVKKFFFQIVRLLFEKILEEKGVIRFEDITLVFDNEPHYRFSERLFSLKTFVSVWEDSDLSNVMDRLARSASKRYKHLNRHPEKTDTKIRMLQD
jgi:hypothetical protein